MSVAIELVEEATRHGIHIAVVDGSLECTSANPLPPAIISKLRSRKADILRLLEGGESVQCTNNNTVVDPHKLVNPHNNTWLGDHADDLKAAGFTDRDIYGQGWFTGLADFHQWQIENLEVQLRGDQLCFTWNNGYTEIKQTCRPDKWR